MVIRRHRCRMVVAAAASILVLVSTGACTVGGDIPVTDPSSSSPTTSTGSLFGAGCPNLPESGPGSLSDLGNRDWIDALAQVPALSQLSVTVALSGLSGDLQGVGEATVFAPNDQAFRRLGVDGGRRLLTNPGAAVDVLSLHILPERLSPDALVGSHTTVTGRSLEIARSDETFTVNGQAVITCGNLNTGNATVYIIDHVLMPR